MVKNEEYVFLGRVIDVLPTHCVVELETDGAPRINASISGKMRFKKILIVKGDRVRVELERTDVTQGRIIYREDKKNITT